MNIDNSNPFSVPASYDFINDSINHGVHIKFDRMPDNLWCRLASDKPIKWVLENTDKIISSTLSVVNHSMKDETIRWEDSKHLEVHVEIRHATTTYILSIEMAAAYLDYFITTYSLKMAE